MLMVRKPLRLSYYHGSVNHTHPIQGPYSPLVSSTVSGLTQEQADISLLLFHIDRYKRAIFKLKSFDGLNIIF